MFGVSLLGENGKCSESTKRQEEMKVERTLADFGDELEMVRKIEERHEGMRVRQYRTAEELSKAQVSSAPRSTARY